MNEFFGRGRRIFLSRALHCGTALTLSPALRAINGSDTTKLGRITFKRIDVFTTKALLGNPLDVFFADSSLNEETMLALTRETFLSEATFVFRRDAALEREKGVRVRIFSKRGELPLAGHPTLGTAFVLRQLLIESQDTVHIGPQICLDLNVGKITVTFTTDKQGRTFGEMLQAVPSFGAIHESKAIAELHNLQAEDIADFAPIQTVSTGMPFVLVPLKRLTQLIKLQIHENKMKRYLETREPNLGFYYVTRDSGHPAIALRARCLSVGGEDAATGSAAGCTAAWLVKHGAASSDERVPICQGVEMGRESNLFTRATLSVDGVSNVRVGGYAVETMKGEVLI